MPSCTSAEHAVTKQPAGEMAAAASSGWQAPFVNVFKLCAVETTGAAAPVKPSAADQHAATEQQAMPKYMGHEKSGRVLERMDPEIGKRVLRITGTIPAGEGGQCSVSQNSVMRMPASVHVVESTTVSILQNCTASKQESTP